MRAVALAMFLMLILAACVPSPPAEPVDITETSPPTGTPQAPATETSTPSPSATPVENTPTSTRVPEEATLTSASTQTAAPDHPTGTSTASGESEALIVDRHSLELFDQIPEEYIQAASEIRFFLHHASVGVNVSFGLDCMMDYFPEYDDPTRRPHACDRDLPPGAAVSDPRYDRTRWVFEIRGNPGWENKVNRFIERVDDFGPQEEFDYAGTILGYVEAPYIMDHFFSNQNLEDQFPSVYDLEALQERHPETRLILWTLALARLSQPYHLEFNDQLREYVRKNDLILMDIADIESHRPDGTPCFGIDRDENPTDVIAVCDEYVEEVFSGHLNSLGRLRMAKAMWVLMAQLAGWRPPG